jgi:hypothetical protein
MTPTAFAAACWRVAALAYWLGGDRETFVADDDGEILGTYYMRPNHAGRDTPAAPPLNSTANGGTRKAGDGEVQPRAAARNIREYWRQRRQAG